jgi:hypothetical protein
MMDEDQELLDSFAREAMHVVNRALLTKGQTLLNCEYADLCWRIAIEMKQARDRICTTAKPAQPDPGPFPSIDLGMIPGTGANHPFEPFEYTERS